jgi:hypothetical protein
MPISNLIVTSAAEKASLALAAARQQLVIVGDFTLNLEVTLVCYDQAVVAAMQPIFASYLDRAMRLELEEWVAGPSCLRLSYIASVASPA